MHNYYFLGGIIYALEMCAVSLLSGGEYVFAKYATNRSFYSIYCGKITKIKPLCLAVF